MSRSNLDKPFYVDVGTSIAAVRIQYDDAVLERYDHVHNKDGISRAEEQCNMMNAAAEQYLKSYLDPMHRALDERVAEVSILRDVLKPILTVNVTADTDEYTVAHRCMSAVADALRKYRESGYGLRKA